MPSWQEASRSIPPGFATHAVRLSKNAGFVGAALRRMSTTSRAPLVNQATNQFGARASTTSLSSTSSRTLRHSWLDTVNNPKGNALPRYPRGLGPFSQISKNPVSVEKPRYPLGLGPYSQSSNVLAGNYIPPSQASMKSRSSWYTPANLYSPHSSPFTVPQPFQTPQPILSILTSPLGTDLHLPLPPEPVPSPQPLPICQQLTWHETVHNPVHARALVLEHYYQYGAPRAHKPWKLVASHEYWTWKIETMEEQIEIYEEQRDGFAAVGISENAERLDRMLEVWKGEYRKWIGMDTPELEKDEMETLMAPSIERIYRGGMEV